MNRGTNIPPGNAKGAWSADSGLHETGHGPGHGQDGRARKNHAEQGHATTGKPLLLYSQEERRRRDESVWTIVQGVLAPLQFVIFIASFVLVIRFLFTGADPFAADLSIVIKTGVLYAIMITGAIWEKAVFGRYLFAPAFFWEDVFSMLVLGLHTAYLVLLFAGIGTAETRMLVALAAYASYLINAGQFLFKLRQARLQANRLAVCAP